MASMAAKQVLLAMEPLAIPGMWFPFVRRAPIMPCGGMPIPASLTTLFAMAGTFSKSAEPRQRQEIRHLDNGFPDLHVCGWIAHALFIVMTFVAKCAALAHSIRNPDA
jgi:hypothetical protein